MARRKIYRWEEAKDRQEVGPIVIENLTHLIRLRALYPDYEERWKKGLRGYKQNLLFTLAEAKALRDSLDIIIKAAIKKGMK